MLCTIVFVLCCLHCYLQNIASLFHAGQQLPLPCLEHTPGVHTYISCVHTLLLHPHTPPVSTHSSWVHTLLCFTVQAGDLYRFLCLVQTPDFGVLGIDICSFRVWLLLYSYHLARQLGLFSVLWPPLLSRITKIPAIPLTCCILFLYSSCIHWNNVFINKVEHHRVFTNNHDYSTHSVACLLTLAVPVILWSVILWSVPAQTVDLMQAPGETELFLSNQHRSGGDLASQT